MSPEHATHASQSERPGFAHEDNAAFARAQLFDAARGYEF